MPNPTEYFKLNPLATKKKKKSIKKKIFLSDGKKLGTVLLQIIQENCMEENGNIL